MKKILVALLLPAALHAQPVNQLTEKDILYAYWECIEISDQAVKNNEEFPQRYMGICIDISRNLQKRFFNDDFSKLHDWTKANKMNKPRSIK